MTAIVVADPQLSRVLRDPLRCSSAGSMLSASVVPFEPMKHLGYDGAQSVELAERIIANVEGYLRAQHP